MKTWTWFVGANIGLVVVQIRKTIAPLGMVEEYQNLDSHVVNTIGHQVWLGRTIRALNESFVVQDKDKSQAWPAGAERCSLTAL